MTSPPNKRPNISTTEKKRTANVKEKSQYTLEFFACLEKQGQRDVLNWCMNIGLISAHYECPKCDNFMRLVERRDIIDGYEWRCRKQGGTASHDICRSVRKGTFFSHSKLTICDILRIIRLWFGRCMYEFVTAEVLVSKNSVIEWYRFCREICTIDIMDESVPIGGKDLIVEVVELEYHFPEIIREQKRSVNGNWIIGGIERGTNKCFFITVSDRSKEKLLVVINEWILPGSVVVSDCFNVYDCLSDENFVELSTNNNLTFKSPSFNKKDNSIEPIWNAVKRFLRNTSSHGEFDPYLGEYLWRKKHLHSMADNVFKSFLQAVINVYNPPGRDLPS